jgi:hypothetical protein
VLNHSGRSRLSLEKQSLYNGDKMTQREFHKAYSAMPESFKAELIGGMVHEPPPPSLMHAEEDSLIITVLKTYRLHTPGTQSGSNGTVILSDEDEVQPDSFLRIQPEFGGQSSNWRRVIKGAPELVAEVSFTSRAIDLHVKKDRYTKFGVKEYIVSCIEPRLFYWFALQRGDVLTVDKDGICRSEIFPGLWMNAQSLLGGREKEVLDTLLLGLESLEHAQFISDLRTRKTR